MGVIENNLQPMQRCPGEQRTLRIRETKTETKEKAEGGKEKMKWMMSALCLLLVCCATIPPKPLCKYMELPVEIVAVPLEDTKVFCLDGDNMDNLGQNYLDLMQCVTDLEIWAIQVEQAMGEK
jgi:hypothetical protein